MIRTVLSLLIFTFTSSLAWAQAPVEGVWNFTMSSQMGSVAAKVVMKTDGSTLTGEFDLGGGRTWPIEEGTIEGNDIAFRINRDGASMTYVMNARIEGDSINGTATAMGSTVDWSMTRDS